MSRSTPSLLALLGLVAVAGYQNRGRISEMLTDARRSSAEPGAHPAPDGGFLSEVGQHFQSGAAGSSLSGALGDLVARFRDAGRGDTADSWVAEGPNKPIDVDELEAAIGPETLDDLAAKTGLTRPELLLRMTTALPDVVNRLSPHGRVPTEAEAQTLV